MLYVALRDNPGYGVLVVGYSLGGGVGQLLAMELMLKQGKTTNHIPKHVLIRCITYGAPPIFDCPGGQRNPKIFSVKNNNDGVRKSVTQT